MQFEYKIQGGDFANAGTASSNVKKVLKQINVDAKIIKRIVVALYEAEINVCAHAFLGKVMVNITPEKIEIDVIDKGPGIQNIDLAMEEGFSTASPAVREMGFGAGMGLPNIKRNTDEMQIESEVNKGTSLRFVNYLISSI
ncbi:MAG: ATP-binding protein [Salinivirgaceae bacterium]|nr:ATP-binding protein [Salinivirgaceae bacterium]MDD4746259.1 ATP-binding protein [Salinivirgaceae bacterium]MDY0281490.1 ATP-binding protein [Salinivirgaceae bacterium]